MGLNSGILFADITCHDREFPFFFHFDAEIQGEIDIVFINYFPLQLNAFNLGKLISRGFMPTISLFGSQVGGQEKNCQNC